MGKTCGSSSSNEYEAVRAWAFLELLGWGVGAGVDLGFIRDPNSPSDTGEEDEVGNLG